MCCEKASCKISESKQFYVSQKGVYMYFYFFELSPKKTAVLKKLYEYCFKILNLKMF